MQRSRSAGRPGNRSLCSILLAGTVALVPAAAGAYSTGPPDGVAGNPPDFFTCVLCHGDFELNSGDGELSLLGVPAEVIPGQSYDLTVRLADPGQMRWGFELTVLDAGLQAAGTIEVLDPVNTQLSDNPGTDPDFLKHTFQGTAAGTPGPNAWVFRWIAGSSASATFYVAGNAANSNGGTTGDYIYAIQVDTGGATPVEPATWGGIKRVFGAGR